MQRDPLVYLDDIVVSCRRIDGYVAGLTLDEFMNNQMTVDAVIRNLEIIGEAVKNIPNDIRQRMPSLDWPRIAGTRDVLIHGYFAVNLKIVWGIATEEIAPLAVRSRPSSRRTDRSLFNLHRSRVRI